MSKKDFIEQCPDVGTLEDYSADRASLADLCFKGDSDFGFADALDAGYEIHDGLNSVDIGADFD